MKKMCYEIYKRGRFIWRYIMYALLQISFFRITVGFIHSKNFTQKCKYYISNKSDKD